MNQQDSRPRGRLLAVGETMAMLTPAQPASIGEADLFRLDAGGAESNVAAHVAALGHVAAWFSALGDDPLGRRILAQLAQRGVDTTAVRVDPAHPTGLYVKDPGAGVYYYRSGSAAAHLGPDVAEGVCLDGTAVVHVSGITAAISRSAAAFLDRVIDRAAGAGVLVSFDVNHRPALWDAATAAPALAALARRAGLVFVGRDEAEVLWGTTTAEDVRALLPDVPQLVVKDGAAGATAFAGGATVFRPARAVRVVDLVGAGDAFAGGYLAALLSGAGLAERLEAGHDRAALTIQTMGDSIPDRAAGPAPR